MVLYYPSTCSLTRGKLLVMIPSRWYPRERRVGVKKTTTLAPCPFWSSFPLHLCPFFSPPCGQCRQTHICSSSFSVRSSLVHVAIVIPPIFFYSSRIGNPFPKRVLIRKKPDRRIAAAMVPTYIRFWCMGPSRHFFLKRVVYTKVMCLIHPQSQPIKRCKH